MPTSMLSSLARGYGTWTGSFDTTVPPQNEYLPSLSPSDHRHGITVTPRSKTPYSEVPIADDGHLEIPKTFVTRKGALMLFTAPEDTPQEPLKTPMRTARYRKRKPKSVIDLSLKLKTIERLSLSILQFGDQSYDKESASISDKDNPLVMNFLHHLEEAERDDTDLHSQPGGDLKFYLRDLKRRASNRGHGAGENGVGLHKARSAELQEILDQLEQAWPHGQREDSIYGGSAPGGGEFFYPASPTPSVSTARSLSRSKVLSSQKLTASLKSLNYLGRPASTEPESTRSLYQERSRPPHDYHYGRSKSARSAVWVTDASTPVYLQPRVTTQGTIFRSSAAQRPLVPSPAGKEFHEDAGLGGGQTPIWADSESRADNASIVSDDLQFRDSAFDLDIRMTAAQDRGENISRAASIRSDPRPFTPMKSERSLSPVVDERSDGEGTQRMLSGAASVLSSLVEEGREPEYVPQDYVSDEEGAFDQDVWTHGNQISQSRASSRLTGRESAMETASRGAATTPSAVGGDVDAVDVAAGAVTAVFVTPGSAKAKGDENAVTEPLQAPYTGILSGKDSGDEIQSRKGEDETMATTISQNVPDKTSGSDQVYDQEAPTPAIEEVKTPTATEITTDPDTLVSLNKEKQAYGSGSPIPSTSSEQQSSQLPSPKPDTTATDSKPSSLPTLTPHPPATPAPGLSLTPQEPPQAEQKEHVAAAEEEEEEEIIEPKPATPKRRERPEEKKKSLIPDLDAEGVEETEEAEIPQGEPGLSERVIREREEREQRAALKKEEQEREAAAKEAEEENLKQLAENKKMAAEERLRQRAEEAAKRKEEEKLKKEEEAKLVEQSPPVPAKGAKSIKKDGKKGDGKKSGKDETKAESALDKLKAKSASGGEIDVDKLKQYMATQPPPPKPKVEKEQVEVPEHLKEMFDRKSKSKGQMELEEEIGKMRMAADQALGGSVLEAVDVSEGLSAEDFESAQEALMEKIKKAEEEILEGGGQQATPTPSSPKKPKPATATATPRTPRTPKAVVPAKSPAGANKKSLSPKRKKDPEAEKKQEQARKRAEQREQEKLEKQRRLEEAKALQQKIKSKEETRRQKEAEAKRKAEELQERMEAIRQEEEELEQAEQDARAQLAAVRKAQREEREARRKADLEKKKQDAIDRREKEKAMMETARQKEQEMLDRIADAEMARRLREEEEAKREEEEMLAQERFEAEMKEAQRAAEEEEERLRDLERQAEEEAFQRLLEEKEEAEERRWELEEQARVMKEEADRAQREMMEEEKRLEEERRKKEVEEEARREQERARLIELQRLEEEAREKMRAQLEQRRTWALLRREQNLASRAHLDAMRQSQGITDPWTFSYFVRWPKESYNRPMGQDPKKQRGFSPKKPKPPPDAAPANPAPPAVDVSAVPN